MMTNFYEPEPRNPEEAHAGCLGTLLGIIIGILLCALLGSCSTCRITEADTIHDTCFIAKVQRDSIICHDSTYVHEYLQGDTVHVDRVRYVAVYRDKVSHDTIFKHIVDTVTQNVYIEKEETMIDRLKNGFTNLLEVIVILIIAAICYLLVFWTKGE